MSHPDPAEEYLTVSEVATKLRVHVSTVYRLADAGDLTAHALGQGKLRRRGLRVAASSVDALLRDRQITTAAA